MSECIFCQIIRKQAPASVVYEDDRVVAFLSDRPVSAGHTLVVPKTHYENIHAIPSVEVGYLFKIVKKVAQAVKDATNVEGIRIVQNNGEAAGQVVFHLHVHVIPLRFHNQFSHDSAYRNPTHYRDEEALEKEAEKIKQQIK
jgi:histidine triad (HIT) family protein